MWCSQCVSNRLLWRLFFLCTGRCGASHKEGQKPPSPKGWTPRSRRTVLLPTTWAHMQKESQTFSPTSFAFRGSRRVGSVNPRKRVSCLIKRQRRRRVDLLASGLEAFPLLRAPAWRCVERTWQRSAAPLQSAIHQLRGRCGAASPLRNSCTKKGPATNGSHPGRRNLHEQPGSEPSSGETARDKQGDTSKR